MSIDSTLLVLQFVMPAIMALSALFAFRKRDKNAAGTTSRGPVVFIVAALAGAWGVLILDTVRKDRSAVAELRRNNELLEQVIRGQYPLQNIRASYQVDLPTTISGLKEYEQRLNDAMPQIASQTSSQKYRQANDIRVAMIEPPGVMFCQKLPAYAVTGQEP